MQDYAQVGVEFVHNRVVRAAAYGSEHADHIP